MKKRRCRSRSTPIPAGAGTLPSARSTSAISPTGRLQQRHERRPEACRGLGAGRRADLAQQYPGRLPRADRSRWLWRDRCLAGGSAPQSEKRERGDRRHGRSDARGVPGQALHHPTRSASRLPTTLHCRMDSVRSMPYRCLLGATNQPTDWIQLADMRALLSALSLILVAFAHQPFERPPRHSRRFGLCAPGRVRPHHLCYAARREGRRAGHPGLPCGACLIAGSIVVPTPGEIPGPSVEPGHVVAYAAPTLLIVRSAFPPSAPPQAPPFA